MTRAREAGQPKILHARASRDARREGLGLDEIDAVIVAELAANARITNQALADRAGIAPSTCLGRVRMLVESGVIRGFHADIDPARLGRSLQAMVAVRVQSNARGRLNAFLQQVVALPGVRNVFLLGGSHDFLVHVAVPDSAALNEFVVHHLSSHVDVALTETSLIFSHARSTGPA